MKIEDIVHQTLIARDAQYANTFFKRFRGLMFKRTMGKEEALILCPCKMIHTFCMRFDIDLIFLSKDKEVLFLIERLTPCSFSPFIKSSFMVIELSSGAIEEKQVKIGDYLSIS